MQVNDLVDNWLKHFNEKYTQYKSKEEEPRYHLKHFFLYSYSFLRKLQNENKWDEYLKQFEELFCRDPANDYYGYRSPLDSQNARENSLEWVAIFEIVNLVGYPYNESAKEKMLINARKYLEEAKNFPDRDYHDIMICSAIEFLPDQFGNYKEWLASWLTEYISVSEPTPHQIVAYMNALKEPKYKDLRDRLFKILLFWIRKPKNYPKRQLLIWARIFSRLDLSRHPELHEIIQRNFFACLHKTFSVDWPNLPLILDTARALSDAKAKSELYNKVSFKIVPSKLLQLKEIFDFLDDNVDFPEVQKEVEAAMEKCSRYKKETCEACIERPQGECWIRILAKVTGRKPLAHGPLEVADFVIYEFERGIYFVIKARPITGVKEGDTLFRQCVKLFSRDHALVFYWNAHKTHPSVLEEIRKTAASMKTKPQFIVVDSKYIRQVYKRYKEIEGH